jgi:hypothetical protein
MEISESYSGTAVTGKDIFITKESTASYRDALAENAKHNIARQTGMVFLNKIAEVLMECALTYSTVLSQKNCNPYLLLKRLTMLSDHRYKFIKQIP